MQPDLRLTEINIYPLKSVAGITQQSWPLEARGLRYDRRWMLVDAEGHFLTQRQQPRMALIQTKLTDSELLLSAPDVAPLSIPFHGEGETRRVKVWGDECQALRCGDSAANWFRQLLQIECELVQMPDDEQRLVDEHYAQAHDEVGFADGFPLLLIGQASLDELNSRLQTPIEMRRFRPNLVIAGAEPFAEDQWKKIMVGGLSFRVVKPCSRCIIPCVDPETGERGKEPLKTLASYRRRDNKIRFGQNLIQDGRGVLRLDQPVSIEI